MASYRILRETFHEGLPSTFEPTGDMFDAGDLEGDASRAAAADHVAALQAETGICHAAVLIA